MDSQFLYSESRPLPTYFAYAVSECLRKLKIPPKFRPYIENHRIGELLAGLTKDILFYKPKDVLTFIKERLEDQIENGRDVPKVIFIAPPYFQRELNVLSNYIASQTGCTPIKLIDLLIVLNNRKKDGCSEASSVNSYDTNLDIIEQRKMDDLRMFQNAASFCENDPWQLDHNISIPNFQLPNIVPPSETREVNISEAYQTFDENKEFMKHPNEIAQLLNLKLQDIKNGWILVDFPRNKEEAQELFRLNIVPTHVILIKIETSGKHEPFKAFNEEDHLNMLKLETVYQHYIREISLCGTNIEDIANKIVETVKIPNYKYVKVAPRVVIIGTRGSGRRTLGDRLSKGLNLVHLNIVQKVVNKSHVDQEEVVERLLTDDCVNNGYVITGFPRTVSEFQFLDRCDNSPNRVIFLSIKDQVCLERLRNRWMNFDTGELMSQTELQADECTKQCFRIHREDELSKIIADQKSDREEVYKMIKYCGDSAIIIDAECTREVLYQRVKNAIEDASPIANVRSCEIHSTDSEETLDKSSMDYSSDTTSCEDIVDLKKMDFTLPFTCAQPNRKIKDVLRDFMET